MQHAHLTSNGCNSRTTHCLARQATALHTLPLMGNNFRTTTARITSKETKCVSLNVSQSMSCTSARFVSLNFYTHATPQQDSSCPHSLQTVISRSPLCCQWRNGPPPGRPKLVKITSNGSSFWPQPKPNYTQGHSKTHPTVLTTLPLLLVVKSNISSKN